MQNSIAEMCEKITAPRITSYLRPSVGFECICMFIIANRSEEKKANRYFVQTKRPCRSLFNFVPHYFYVFFFIQFRQKRLLMYLLLYIYRQLFNPLLTL